MSNYVELEVGLIESLQQLNLFEIMFFSMGVSISVTPPRMSGNLARLENQFCVKTFARMSLTNEQKFATKTKCETKSIKKMCV